MRKLLSCLTILENMTFMGASAGESALLYGSSEENGVVAVLLSILQAISGYGRFYSSGQMALHRLWVLWFG